MHACMASQCNSFPTQKWRLLVSYKEKTKIWLTATASILVAQNLSVLLKTYALITVSLLLRRRIAELHQRATCPLPVHPVYEVHQYNNKLMISLILRRDPHTVCIHRFRKMCRKFIDDVYNIASINNNAEF